MHRFFANPTYAIYLAGFVFSAQLALTAYVNSSFLGQFVSTRTTGLVFSVAAIIGIIAYGQIARTVRKIGIRAFLVGLLLADGLLMLVLQSARTPSQAIPAFILWIIANNCIVIGLDILLEHYSKDSSTGSTRGAYLTATNAAWVFAPLASASIIGNLSYHAVYLAGALLMIPVFVLVYIRFKGIKQPQEKPEIKAFAALANIFRNPKLRGVFMANFLLQAFYVLMVIYVPIYLRTTLGYDWSDIGIMFTVMLLPFVLFEYLFGRIADKYNCERLMIAFGFALMALASGALFYIGHGSIALWATILFLTRTGAAAVEVTSESYLFKQITDAERGTISLFRTLSPTAYILIPTVASLATAFHGEPAIFFVAAGLGVTGVFVSSKLQ